MRSRTPLALAGLLIIALVATIGVAAFSTGIVGSSTTTQAETFDELGTSLPISGRVASAVFALSVSPERNAVVAPVESSGGDGGAAPSSDPVDPGSSTTTVAGNTETTIAGTTATTAAEAGDDAAGSGTVQTQAVELDTSPPAVRITSPRDGATVKNRVVTLQGVAERGAAVFVGQWDADVDSAGAFSIDVHLVPGKNGAGVTARDKSGNVATARISIFYDAPTTTTATKAPSTTSAPKSSAPKSSTATTKAPAATTTTQAPTTTKAPSTSSSGYSSQWPPDGGGQRSVENWRSVVAQYWPADRVDCVLGIMYRESRGDPRAHNRSSNAMGLLQHLLKYWPSRAKGAGFVDGNGNVADPFNGAANIAAGAWLANYHESRGANWWNPWSRLPDYGNCSG